MRREIDRINDLVALAEAGDQAPYAGSGDVLCVTTTAGTYPTSAGVFYLLLPATVGGAEVAGGAGTVTPATGPATKGFLAFNLGSAVPPNGTNVVCSTLGSRRVFRYDG